MKRYTVILVVPDYLCETYGHDHCLAQVRARNPAQAVDKAIDWAGGQYAGRIEPDDWYVVAVFPGYLQDQRD